jgi:DNA ligase (NAD+)
MEKDEAAKELERLAREIARHDGLYYNMASPEISDREYDELRRANARLEAQYPDLVRPDSPSHRIGATPQAEFQKVNHTTPMTSLEDIFSEKELDDFFERTSRFLKISEKQFVCPDRSMWAELKIDGLSASLVYVDGVFAKGATRGDGTVGEDVTQNIKTIQDVPLSIAHSGISRIEIRGEVYMSKQAFALLNEEQAKNNERMFQNPRNAAAGSLRQLDASITRARRLRFLAYDVVTDDFDTQEQVISYLNNCGFCTPAPARLCNSREELQDYHQYINSIRAQIPYEIDGVVYKANDRKLQRRLGVVGRVPRHSLAYKFKAQQVETRILGISLQVGRTGVITPVAELEPISVGGALVSKATLHNKDEIERLDARIGDVVILQRAGDVIPQIVSVVKGKRNGDEPCFAFPIHCPSCDDPLEDGRCVAGFRCRAQAIQRLSHFVTALEIDGLGERNIEFLYDTGRVRDFVDIFTLQQRNAKCSRPGDLFQQPTKVSPLEYEDGWGSASVLKLFKAIDVCRSVAFDKFLYALGVPQVGKQMASLLSQNFKDFSELLSCHSGKLMQIDGVGEKTAEGIVEYLHEQRDVIARLLSYVTLSKEASQLSLSEERIVFTGKFDKFSRNEGKAQATKLGAQIASTVSRSTTIVVAGKDPGENKDKAKTLGVKIVNEDEWLQIIAQL